MELKIPGYEVKAVIGKGGMAEVYLALHTRLDREVALKVMSSRYSDDEAFTERFMREARIAANLSHHNVVQVYDANHHEHKLYLSMEYIRGGDLTSRMLKPHQKEAVVKVVTDLAHALDYAHGQGYIHRDVKPANILFREDGSLALSDFGIARAINNDVNVTQTGMVVGTPSYMSPEQAQGLELSGQSDLYAVAVIAYQLATGELPYQADSSISVAIKHISDPIPTLPPALAAMQPFFDRALAKKSQDRFESGAELAIAFSEYLKGVNQALPFNSSAVTTQVSGVPLAHSEKQDATKHELNASGYLGTELIRSDENSKSLQVNKAMDTMNMTRHQSNIQMVFMQINKFKVFITEPQKRSVLVIAMLVLLTLGVGGLLAGQFGLLGQKKALSPGQQARIGQLLQAADLDFSADKLVEPAGANAYEKYLAILAISPNDVVALQGIQFITNELESKFNLALQSGDLKQAEWLFGKITEIQLDGERTQLEQRLLAAKEARQALISNNLSEAAAALQRGDTDAAAERYGDVLSADSDSIEAQQALRNIVAAELGMLEKYIGSGDFELASSTLETAKKSSSILNEKTTQDRIVILEQQLNSGRAAAKISNEIRSIIEKGDAALAAENWDRPMGTSAYYYYSEALKVDAKSARARKGLDSVFDAMENRVSRYIAENKATEAQILLDRLGAIDPSNGSLATYRSQIKIKREALQRQASIDNKVSVLYRRANTYLSANRARAADKIHLQISRLSPNDPGLAPLGARIADAYVFLAQREIDAQDWEDVDVWVSRGLVHVPSHRKLLEMRAYANLKMQQR